MDRSFSNIDAFEPSSYDRDVFISTMPFDMIKESIKKQFNEPYENETDYVGIFMDSYYTSLAEYEGDEDAIIQLRDMKDELINLVRGCLYLRFQVGFADLEELNEELANDMVKYVYRFFIINTFKNMTHFITNYIIENKEEICNKYIDAQSSIDNNDVTSVKIRKIVYDKEICIILSNLITIINDIFDDYDDVDIDTFLSHAGQDKLMETRFIDKCYNEYHVTGNFIQPYFKLTNNFIKRELFVKVRSKLINKYSK